MDEEEDDPVVQEVDVFLSKQLAENLLLLQYPVRPAHMTYDNVEHLGARVKPKQQKMELEIAVDTHSPNYASSKGEQIALNVDGKDPGENPFYSSERMDKQVLSSTPAGIPPSRYVIGAFKDGELHISPLKGIIQMKPNFAYLDQADSRQRTEGVPGGATEGTAGGDSSQEEEEEAKPVMVRFARHETEEGRQRRMASYEYMRKCQEEEAWINVNYHQVQDPLAEIERQQLYARHTNDASEFHMAESEYLKKLIPQQEEELTEKPALPSHVLSMTELKNMSLSDQVRALLRSAKVIRFSQLMSLLPKSSDPAAVLRFVQQVALLVQGSWVVKSDVLYPKDSSSAYSGVPADTLARGRDYIMWRYTQNRYLVRKDISSVIKLPADDIKDILEQMALLKVNKGWEFLMEYDSEFVNRHPEVVQRQQMLWDAKFQQLSKVLNITKLDLKLADKAAAAAASLSPKRRRTVSRSHTKSGGMSDMSDNDVDAAANPGGARQRTPSGTEPRRHTSRTSIASATDANPLAVHASATEDNGTAHGPSDSVEVLIDAMEISEDNGRSSSAQSSSVCLLELNAFVLEKLRSRCVLTMSELKRLFTLKLAECPPGHILGSGVSDKMLEQAVYDVGGVKISLNVSTSLGDQIFVFPKFNDILDPIREVIVKMLGEKMPMKMNNVRKRLEETFSNIPPETDIRKVMKEYMFTRGNCWYIKGAFSQDS